MSNFSDDERQQFLESILKLHEEIADEISKPQMDPGRLMRLTALGVNHCLVGIATLLGNHDMQPTSIEQRTKCSAAATESFPGQEMFSIPGNDLGK